MRILLNQVGDMDTICVMNIGGCPQNRSDTSRIIKSLSDMYKRCNVKDHVTILHKYVDLQDGEDFLLLQIKADVVILHWIWDGPRNTPYSVYWKSPLHNIDNWRISLSRTCAAYIYVYGEVDEVSGIKLGSIPDYCRVLCDTDLAVYERLQ
jgi:hypothetical protein